MTNEHLIVGYAVIFGIAGLAWVHLRERPDDDHPIYPLDGEVPTLKGWIVEFFDKFRR